METGNESLRKRLDTIGNKFVGLCGHMTNFLPFLHENIKRYKGKGKRLR